MNRIGWLVLITVVATLFAPPTLAHESRAVLAASPETLGHVHFPISCSLAAQEQFDRALAMLHSFWFPQATEAFIAITQSEPDCAMAHWGVAMSQRWNQVEIQRRAASAWVAQTEGKKDEALQLMRSAADLEDASEKHVAMENRPWPMHDLLGELILETNQPARALDEFEASLKTSRNRLRGLYGAARASELSGAFVGTR